MISYSFFLDFYFSVLNKNTSYYHRQVRLFYQCMEDMTLRDTSDHLISSQDLICFHPEICFGENISDVLATFIQENSLIGKTLSVQRSMYFYNYERFQHLSFVRVFIYYKDWAKTWYVSERNHREYLEWKCENSEKRWRKGILKYNVTINILVFFRF